MITYSCLSSFPKPLRKSVKSVDEKRFPQITQIYAETFIGRIKNVFELSDGFVTILRCPTGAQEAQEAQAGTK